MKPIRLQVGIGGYSGPSYSVELTGEGLRYTAEAEMYQEPRIELIHPTERQWQNFRATLDRLKVWNWREHYASELVICDGTSWGVEIVYEDAVLKSAGSNNFPEDPGATRETSNPHQRFDRFLRAVGRLAGGKPID